MSEMRFKHRWLTFAISLLLGLPLLMVGGGRILGLDRHLVQPRAATAPRVAIIHWPTAPTDEDVETMVRQGLELALGPSGMGAVVAPGDLVLLKPKARGYHIGAVDFDG